MPPTYVLIQWALKAVWVFFAFAYGACIGSLINVIVYRRPRGISVITPPSRCPKCDTRLTWRDNIPVLGWLILRGRCRYCKAPISAEYPLVEAAVGLLFCLFYVVWYVLPDTRQFDVLGVNLGAMKPDFALNDPASNWPTFVLLLVLLSALVATTIIDAKTFTIPLELTWVPALAAVIIHPLHAIIAGRQFYPAAFGTGLWAIPTPAGAVRWDIVGAAVGGVLGLGVGLLLLQLGLIRRSFADYDEWERSVLEEQKRQAAEAAAGAAAADAPAADPTQGGPAAFSAAPEGPARVLRPTGHIELTPARDADPTELWVQYPHARREMIKELAFLAPCVLLAMGGFYLFRYLGGVTWRDELGLYVLDPSAPFGGAQVPLWLTVLTGVLIGYLVGGGVVWLVRILGSLAFGKEAMGLGDVHLMAAVGACLGWIHATLAFFLAAFVGLAWVLISTVAGGRLRRTMPYGPYLAIATVLLYLGMPLVEAGLSHLVGRPVNLPP